MPPPSPIPYLTFQNGTCEEAFTAYARIFGAAPPMFMRVSDTPEGEWPEDKMGWIMHGHLTLGESAIYGSDDIEGGTPPMQGVSIMMELPTAAEGKTVYDALAEGGEIRMAYEPTFWSPGFGTLTDRWGIRWMISTTEEP
ncbi:VOC family protein [Histidinibacterium aquaticum]|uniref:VOC family protein n=1 Tax=Histidinibacterium aquaticum TaxID=2613962 RepID=A0A5J5GKG2_9RHOB|nr:VOC family protein [Histidinibacterium aquaticum]KAA9008153.1 VOC family protein [Histidinibacterium aquaticum]